MQAWVLLALQAAATNLQLEKLIVYSRHGIRVPYTPAGGAGIYSKSPREWYTNFSDWGAEGPAYLTPHGARVVERMGEHFRQQLVTGSKLLPDDGTRITVYADHDPTGRDIKTAEAFFRGLLPGVPVTVHADPEQVVLMFNQGALPGGNNSACEPWRRQDCQKRS